MAFSGYPIGNGVQRVYSAPDLPSQVADTANPELFSGILAADYAAISAAARVRNYSRGEILFLKGEIAQHVLLLTSGFVKITQIGFAGNAAIVRVNSPGDVLGASGVLSGGRHDTTAYAFRACRALSWEAGLFRVLAQRYPILHQNMVGILGRELLELEERFHEMATEKVGPRVIRQLMRLTSKMGVCVEHGIQINVSREELAQMTGTTLFTVSRLLSSWEDMGAVKPSREAVTICDHEVLLSTCLEQ